MEELLIQNAAAYASQQHFQLAERLGFGIHGIIFIAEDKSAAGKTAVKAHWKRWIITWWMRLSIIIAFLG